MTAKVQGDCCDCFYQGWEIAQGTVDTALSAVSWGGRKIKACALWTGRGTANYFTSDRYAPQKTAGYIKSNWKYILASVAAWGVVLTLAGALYGFKAVALPLVIGGTCGLGGGVVVAAIVVVLMRPSKKHRNYTSLWGAISALMDKLDPHGTRPIVIAIATTVMLAACVIFPYLLAFIVGLVIGNHVMTNILLYQNTRIPDLEKKLEEARVVFEKIQNKLVRDIRLERKYRDEIKTGPYLEKIDKLKDILESISNDLSYVQKEEFYSNIRIKPLPEDPTLKDVKKQVDRLIDRLDELNEAFAPFQKGEGKE